MATAPIRRPLAPSLYLPLQAVVRPGPLRAVLVWPMTAPASETPLSVVQALAGVMAELPNIGKDDQSPEGYRYRGVEAVTKHLQPLLAKHGVVIVPKAQVLATVPSPAMKDGWQDVLMQVDWSVYGPDGSCIEATTNGIGRDRSDKGANKAQTQAFKYLILHLFCIADGKDDADGQTYEHDRAATLAGNELTAKDAKGALLDHVHGDKDAAAAAWTAAGLDGRWKVTDRDLDRALDEADRLAQLDETAAPGDGAEPPPSGSAPDPDTPLAQFETDAEHIADKAARTPGGES